LIIHQEGGEQYAGNAFKSGPDTRRNIQRITRIDNLYDNAFKKSYFGSFNAKLMQNSVFGKKDALTKIF